MTIDIPGFPGRCMYYQNTCTYKGSCIYVSKCNNDATQTYALGQRNFFSIDRTQILDSIEKKLE